MQNMITKIDNSQGMGATILFPHLRMNPWWPLFVTKDMNCKAQQTIDVQDNQGTVQESLERDCWHSPLFLGSPPLGNIVNLFSKTTTWKLGLFVRTNGQVSTINNLFCLSSGSCVPPILFFPSLHLGLLIQDYKCSSHYSFYEQLGCHVW